MLLKQMEYFVTIVKYGSFTEAAQECYISQSAISQQIKVLEMELGVELFIRKNRKIFLTKAGDFFYKKSLKMLHEAEQIKKDTYRIVHGEEKKLRMGYLRSLNSDELGMAISDFLELYPDIDVEIFKGNHEELYERMKNNELDMVLNDQRRVFSNEYINFELFTGYSYVEMNHKNHLSALQQLAPEDLSDIPCILISSNEQQEVEREYYRNSMGFGEDYFFAESKEEAKLLVAGNRGFLPIEQHNKVEKNGTTILQIPLIREGKQIARTYCVFWKKIKDCIMYQDFAGFLQKQYQNNG